MGEVALCQPLHDPQGAIAQLKTSTSPYPDKLREALLNRFMWEVLFSIENGSACGRPRPLCCIGQVLFALNRRYLINEKGLWRKQLSFRVAYPACQSGCPCLDGHR